jgi:hypothetical protein
LQIDTKSSAGSNIGMASFVSAAGISSANCADFTHRFMEHGAWSMKHGILKNLFHVLCFMFHDLVDLLQSLTYHRKVN